MKKILLCIMDGVGLTKEKKYNALYNAKTPNLDKLWKTYPHSELEASGTYVGLPRGQMGNSEASSSLCGYVFHNLSRLGVLDRKSTRLNSSHPLSPRMPSSA